MTGERDSCRKRRNAGRGIPPFSYVPYDALSSACRTEEKRAAPGASFFVGNIPLAVGTDHSTGPHQFPAVRTLKISLLF